MMNNKPLEYVIINLTEKALIAEIFKNQDHEGLMDLFTTLEVFDESVQDRWMNTFSQLNSSN
jgi:hypothetical protein